ncbi:hypothetical protein PBY51_014685 [Eleginops maclovinus]|uniref:Uncharacterized protein n=1 Tax=Eleginops maclovinus TaxID=56733 RepID=A0AAN8A6X6_ELEMC|nr:hypothetical protein PBY51_014685 [Eleginops maclovinus]
MEILDSCGRCSIQSSDSIPHVGIRGKCRIKSAIPQPGRSNQATPFAAATPPPQQVSPVGTSIRRRRHR